MSGPAGPNVGAAWVALRFSARGAASQVKRELDQELKSTGDDAGTRIGEDLSKAVNNRTRGLGSIIGSRFGSDLTRAATKNTNVEPLTKKLQGLNVNGMAVVAAGATALSPIIATLGTGFIGLGAAADGVVKPIIAAAGSGKAATKALKELDPAQKQALTSLLALKQGYKGFSKSLEPTLLDAFNKAMKIGGNLMKDAQPVALATGKAFDQFLGQFGATLQDPQWKSFWNFMARTAPEDMHLVSNAVISLTNDLPSLVQNLQPAATSLLRLASGSAHAVGAMESLNAATIHGTSGQGKPWWERAGEGILHFGFEVGTLGLISQHSSKSVSGLARSTTPIPPMINTWAAAQKTLNTAIKNGITPLGSFISETITQRDDLKSLNVALKASHNQIGLKTQAERNAYQAAQTYIAQTLSTAQAAVKAHRGVDSQILSIKNALGPLESVRGKTKAYRAELGLLRDMLQKLEAYKYLNEHINITGRGQWAVASGLQRQLPGKRSARGWRVPGSGNGDTVPAWLTPGEAVVPKRLVPAVAPFLRANGVPGFAAGGIIPDYRGTPGGLRPWTARDNRATMNAITAAIGNALSNQIPNLTASNMGGNVTSWVSAALRIAGAPLSWLAAELRLVSKESGGNPRAYNPISVGGQHAEGLAQMLPSTFAAYSRGGSIWNPIANMVASLFYQRARYGSPYNIPGLFGGSYGGYDSGGIARGLGFLPKRTIKPERVLSPSQTKAFERLVDALDGRAASREPRAIRVTGKVDFDPRKAEMYFRDLAGQEARAEIAFAR